MSKKECLLCGKEILNEEVVCDECEKLSPYELTLKYCLSEKKITNPLNLFLKIVATPNVKIHGPEHHFIIPAVLLTTYYNKMEDYNTKELKLSEALERSKSVLGGFCGKWGACGAAIGTGIFYSLIDSTTPKSTNTWKDCQLLTASTLEKIANTNGPRCCKRASYIAICEAVKYIKDMKNIELDISENIKCEYSKKNPDCQKEKCKYN